MDIKIRILSLKGDTLRLMKAGDCTIKK